MFRRPALAALAIILISAVVCQHLLGHRKHTVAVKSGIEIGQVLKLTHCGQFIRKLGCPLGFIQPVEIRRRSCRVVMNCLLGQFFNEVLIEERHTVRTINGRFWADYSFDRVLPSNVVPWLAQGLGPTDTANFYCKLSASSLAAIRECGSESVFSRFLNREPYFESRQKDVRTLTANHGSQLLVHCASLFFGITRGNADGYKADDCREPQSDDPSSLPPSIAFFLGAILVVTSIKFLFYAMECRDYLFWIAFIGGFAPFGIGVWLIFACFLPILSPVPIFGFVVTHPFPL